MPANYKKKPRVAVNIELYIQSGIVESYALGLATPLEVAEFEQLLPHFPELREVLSDFEYRLELFAIDNEEPPPPGIQEKIEARLREIQAVPRITHSNGRQYRRRQSGEYIPIETSSPYVIMVHKAWRTWFIVFCILSKITLGLSIYYFLEYRHARRQIQQLEEQLGKREGAGAASAGEGGRKRRGGGEIG